MMFRLRVKEVAEQKGISWKRLSRLADVDYRVVVKVIRDPYASITTETLQRLATALGVSVVELIEEVTPNTP